MRRIYSEFYRCIRQQHLKDKTPQDTIRNPRTMYGVTKVSGELLSDYYNIRFGVDTRSVRFPGLISYVTPPGGGTTDYAVDIYYSAAKGEKFICPIGKGTLHGYDVYAGCFYAPPSKSWKQTRASSFTATHSTLLQ